MDYSFYFCVMKWTLNIKFIIIAAAAAAYKYVLKYTVESLWFNKSLFLFSISIGLLQKSKRQISGDTGPDNYLSSAITTLRFMHYFPKGFIWVVPQHPRFQPLKEVPVLLWALLFALVLKPHPGCAQGYETLPPWQERSHSNGPALPHPNPHLTACISPKASQTPPGCVVVQPQVPSLQKEGFALPGSPGGWQIPNPALLPAWLAEPW